MEDIKFEGTSFSITWVSCFTTVSEFISDCPPHICEGENREKKLTELYNMVNKKKK